MFRKKLNLGRFKKSMQGLIDFAVLLEQADPSNQKKIITETQAEDPEFLGKAMRKVIFFDELIYLDESVLAEILSSASPKIIAYALRGTSDEYKKLILNCLGHREKKLVQEEEDRGADVSPSYTRGAQKQILKIARAQEKKGLFNLELTDCPRFQAPRKKKAPG